MKNGERRMGDSENSQSATRNSLQEAFAIAEYLYKAGRTGNGERRMGKGENVRNPQFDIRNSPPQSAIRNPYSEIYAWIKTQVKRRKDLALVLQALKQLRIYHDAGKEVIEFWPYMEGTMRRLEAEKEGKAIRRGRGASFEEILARAWERVKAKREGAR